MSECSRGIKCPCFCCLETDCEHYQSEAPEWINGVEEVLRSLPAVQPDHVADIGKKADGDCISRRAAIDALARMMPRSYTPDGSHPADEEIFRAQEVFADCIEVLEILPSAQPEPHWIPCSERMPVEGQKCLVCDKGSIGIDTYIGHGNPYNWKWYTRDYEAWMPLPEPYRGGDSE